MRDTKTFADWVMTVTVSILCLLGGTALLKYIFTPTPRPQIHIEIGEIDNSQHVRTDVDARTTCGWLSWNCKGGGAND